MVELNILRIEGSDDNKICEARLSALIVFDMSLDEEKKQNNYR